MFKLLFTNSKGESIELFGRPFRLLRFEGLGDVEADVQRQKSPFQDGTTYIDSVLEDKSFEIELKITAKNQDELAYYRKKLASVFNPKLGLGILKRIESDEVMQIEAIPESVPFFPDGASNRSRTFQRAVINMIAPNPYWQSPSITEEPAFEGLFEFPFEGEFEMGIQRDERIIYNDGDAPAPIHVIFYGPAQEPQIANLTTGEFIKINKYLYENEKLIIDTAEKSVFYEDENGNRENVFHWLDLDSTFFNLEIGENEISCMCAVSNLVKEFEISYRKLYVGV